MDNVVEKLFPSFFLGGFECSSQRLPRGRRIDMIRATAHEKWADQDYGRLRSVGIRAARDGLRWHLVEKTPGHYDFSSVEPILRAARKHGIRVIWDICHYGWPDDLSIFGAEFVDRLAALTRTFVAYHVETTGEAPFIAPVNEISFFAWAGGQVALFNPTKRRRGDELKAQLVRATIAAIEAAWSVAPATRIIHTDPIINVIGDERSLRAQNRARAYHEAQYQAWDMISGRWKPELGGRPEYLDLIGANYYPNNQWKVYKTEAGATNPPHLSLTDPDYRPLRSLLQDLWQRYRRPLFLAETGTEDDARPTWLRYVCDEVEAAIREGCDIQGICLYPIANHPG